MSVLHYMRKHGAALALLLILLGGWLAVPVSWAMPEPITCGMVCCEESGECCCFLARQAHQHEDGDGEDDARLLAFRKSCPSDCATPSVSRNVVQDVKPLASLLRWDWNARDELPVLQTIYPLRLVQYRRAAPRAPPFRV